MAKMVHARTTFVMAAVMVLGAMLSSDLAAQEVRQDRPRQQIRLAQQTPLMELVLLPEPIPLPLQVPVLQQAPLPEQTPALPAAPPAVQIPPPPLVQSLDQTTPLPQVQSPDPLPLTVPARTLLVARFPQQTPPSEQTEPVEPARIVELTSATPQASPELAALEATFEAPDYPPPNPAFSTKDHPAVGAWMGMAVQVCPDGVAPSACAFGQKALTIFMTPTLTADGLFFGDDSSTIVDPPYGPHTTAYGSWVPTSATEFTSDYVFMTRAYPPTAGVTTAGVRARWVAKVIDANTIVGWVNAYFLDPAPIKWRPLLVNEFPVLPNEALPFVTPPNGFIQDPLLCPGTGCPLVLKFTIKRVAR